MVIFIAIPPSPRPEPNHHKPGPNPGTNTMNDSVIVCVVLPAGGGKGRPLNVGWSRERNTPLHPVLNLIQADQIALRVARRPPISAVMCGCFV